SARIFRLVSLAYELCLCQRLWTRARDPFREGIPVLRCSGWHVCFGPQMSAALPALTVFQQFALLLLIAAALGLVASSLGVTLLLFAVGLKLDPQLVRHFGPVSARRWP